MSRFLPLVFMLICAITCAQADAHSAPTAWPQYQYSVTHNAVFEGDLRAVWRVAFDRKTNGGIAISNDVIYTDNFDKYVYAIDARTGYTIWKSALANIAMTTPVIADDIVIVGSGVNASLHPGDPANNMWGVPQGDDIYAFQARTGRLLWKYHTVGDDMSTPAIADGCVIFANGDMHAYALDLHTGKLRWKTALPGIASMDSVMLRDGTAFIGVWFNHPFAPKTLAIDVASGKIRWHSTLGSADLTATLDDGLLFTGTTMYDPAHYEYGGSSTIAALSQQTGKTIWTYVHAPGVCSYVGSGEHEIAGTVASGVLFESAGCSSQMLALDEKSGKVLWSFTASAPIKMSPVIAQDRLYFGDTAGSFYVLDARDGSEIYAVSFSEPFTTSSPVILGKTLLIANSSILYALPLDTLPSLEDLQRIPTYSPRCDVLRYINGKPTNGHTSSRCAHA